ncbi:unnamed protein product [Ilex paraguariensis]|uniref:Uncharacterized protein n=1 Tax=Ilex paraguariensis TaxID=185542 RepID=A0ABC8SRX0_9AQUA
MDKQNHDIVVHFKNSIFTINGVNSDRYCCMDMVTDVAQVPNVFIGDSVSKEMFSLYRNCKEIHVFVNTEIGSQVELSPPLDVGIAEDYTEIDDVRQTDENDDNEPNGENDANRHEVDDINGDKHTMGVVKMMTMFLVLVMRMRTR